MRHWAERTTAAGLPVRSKGFTLIEVVVALAVVAVAALGILSSLSAGYVVDREATQSLEAQNLARRALEELFEVPFEDLLAEYGGTQVREGDLTALIRAEQIEPPEGSASLVRLEVRVRRSGDGRQLFTLVCFRANRHSPASAWRTRG